MNLLSHKALQSYRDAIVMPIIEHSIARVVVRNGSADLAADFDDGIPPRVICALLGVPWRDDELVAKTLHLHEESQVAL
jgi:cytochrome P450